MRAFPAAINPKGKNGCVVAHHLGRTALMLAFYHPSQGSYCPCATRYPTDNSAMSRVLHHGTPLTQGRRAQRHFSPSEIADIRVSARTLFAEEHRRSASRPVREDATELWGASLGQDALTQLQLRTRAAVVLQQLSSERRLWAPATGVTEWDVAAAELEEAAICRETTQAEAEAARAELREAQVSYSAPTLSALAQAKHEDVCIWLGARSAGTSLKSPLGRPREHT